MTTHNLDLDVDFDSEQVYTVREVANKLKYSEHHIRFLLRTGVISGIQRGRGKWLVHQNQIDQFLNKYTKTRSLGNGDSAGEEDFGF